MSNKIKKKKNTILNLLICICAIVFLYSAFKLASYYFEYKKMDQVYANINENIVGNLVFEPDSEGLLKQAPKIDMAALKAINSEIVGYILIPKTKISYPVAYSSDPLKYLNYDIENNRSRAGAIFVEPNNEPDFSDDNTIIYGHNMFDGSMFSELGNYVTDETYFKTHCYIYLYTENEIRLYRVFSSHVTKEGSEVYTMGFGNQAALDGYVSTQMAASQYTPRIQPEHPESLITLSTCKSGSGPERYVVLAYLVDTLPQ